MGDVLRLAALEAPSEDLSITPAEKGLLVHRILERFITAVLSDGDMPGPDRSWSQPHWDLLNRIAEEEFRQSESHGVTGRLLLWRVAKEDIRDDLARFIEEGRSLAVGGMEAVSCRATIRICRE